MKVKYWTLLKSVNRAVLLPEVSSTPHINAQEVQHRGNPREWQLIQFYNVMALWVLTFNRWLQSLCERGTAFPIVRHIEKHCILQCLTSSASPRSCPSSQAVGHTTSCNFRALSRVTLWSPPVASVDGLPSPVELKEKDLSRARGFSVLLSVW